MSKTITVTVTRTQQAAQYEPVTVTVSETVKVEDSEDSMEVHEQVYRGVTKSVKRQIDNEIAKYQTAEKRDKKRSK